MLVSAVRSDGVVGLTDNRTEKILKIAAVHWGDGHKSSPRSVHNDMNAYVVIDQSCTE